MTAPAPMGCCNMPRGDRLACNRSLTSGCSCSCHYPASGNASVVIPAWAEREGAEWRLIPLGGLDKALALLAEHHACLPIGFEDKCVCLACEVGRALTGGSTANPTEATNGNAPLRSSGNAE